MTKSIIIGIAAALVALSASAGEITTITDRKTPSATTKEPVSTRVICDEDFTEI